MTTQPTQLTDGRIDLMNWLEAADARTESLGPSRFREAADYIIALNHEVDSLTTKLAAAEMERDHWKERSEIIAGHHESAEARAYAAEAALGEARRVAIEDDLSRHNRERADAELEVARDAFFSEVERELIYRDIFAEITAKAQPLEFDPNDPERILAYRVPCGPLHRAAGKLGFQMFDGERLLVAALKEIADLKAKLAERE